jgi:formylglycine-generating enzyme required for sulfatase activity
VYQRASLELERTTSEVAPPTVPMHPDERPSAGARSAHLEAAATERDTPSPARQQWLESLRPPHLHFDTSRPTAHTTPPQAPPERRRSLAVTGVGVGLALGVSLVVMAQRERAAAQAQQESVVIEAPSAARVDRADLAAYTARQVHIPAGTFAVGSLVGEDDEHPLRKVMIDAFELDATEVKVGAWLRCELAGGCPPLLEISQATSPECNLPFEERREHPINCVTWDEAAAFCRWESATLPSEDQWEYAAASGGEGRVNVFPWGAMANPLLANGVGAEDGFLTTAPAGSFPRGASDFGALDMAGNVEEWTADAYSVPGSNAPPDARRVTRGGSYESDARGLRAARRGKADPGARAPTRGFRCVHGG